MDRYDDYIYGRASHQRDREELAKASLLAAGSETVGAPSHWFAKLLAILFLGICLVLGVVGAILPIVPGILFFGFAALIAAWLFPPLRGVLERQPHLSHYMNATAGFSTLPWRRQVRVVAWLSMKFMVDSFRLLIEGVARLIRLAGSSAP